MASINDIDFGNDSVLNMAREILAPGVFNVGEVHIRLPNHFSGGGCW